ncbi:MAG: hypothetical protein ACXAD7_07890 [Candidatus Kariarchaeaceae archaeon]|jgi:SAM-dependent methyltransferase
MPDSTRPKSSMFFQVVKGILTGDGALKRIINNPGGKNFSIIFAYLTSKAFEISLLKPNLHGKIGRDAFEDQWLTPMRFLKKMQWGGPEEPTIFARYMIKELFNSFVQDKALKSKIEDGKIFFKYQKDLDYPAEEQLNEARASNKYFMQVIDDLTDLIPKSLEQGEPVHERTKSAMGPLWEAFLSDPLVKSFEDEMVYQVMSNFPKKSDGEELNIVQFGSGAGNGTIGFINHILEEYRNVRVNIYCYEESAILITRARELLGYFNSENRDKYAERGLEINFEYFAQSFKEEVKLENTAVDIVMCFQCMQWLSKEQRKEFFGRLAKIVSKDGCAILGQSSSYNEDFPYPLTLMYLNVMGFSSFPTKDEITRRTEPFFKNIKSSGLDAMWVLKKPRS